MFLCAPFHFPPTFYESINFQEHPFLFKTNGKFFHHLYEMLFFWAGACFGTVLYSVQGLSGDRLGEGA